MSYNNYSYIIFLQESLRSLSKHMYPKNPSPNPKRLKLTPHINGKIAKCIGQKATNPNLP
jgi:hypothetical protein